MCLFIPGRDVLELPFNEWVCRPTYDSMYWYLLGIFFVFSTGFLIIVPSMLLVLMAFDLLFLISGSLFNLFLPSLFLSLPFLYIFLKNSMFYQYAAVRISSEKIAVDLDSKIRLALEVCFSRFSEKHKDSGELVEYRFFNDFFFLKVYVRKDYEYATLKFRIYSKKDREKFTCFIDALSRELCIDNRILSVQEVKARIKGSSGPEDV